MHIASSIYYVTSLASITICVSFSQPKSGDRLSRSISRARWILSLSRLFGVGDPKSTCASLDEGTEAATDTVDIGSKNPAATLLLDARLSNCWFVVDADDAVVAAAADAVVCETDDFGRAADDVCIDVLLVVGAKLGAIPDVAVPTEPLDFVVDEDADSVEESSCCVVLSVAPCTVIGMGLIKWISARNIRFSYPAMITLSQRTNCYWPPPQLQPPRPRTTSGSAYWLYYGFEFLMWWYLWNIINASIHC